MKKFLSLILAVVMIFSVPTTTLMVNAASSNTVKTSISKIESKAKGFKVTYKKKSKIKGYQIQYSTSSKFKGSSTKIKTITNYKTTSATISKLKGCNVKYYVRVRTYKVSKGEKIYSSWSKAKTVTTLKHKYSKATCTKAKTCKYCKKTSGKKLGHKYTNVCDTKCNVCKAKRTAPHKYSNACDIKCNICKAKRKAPHKYTNACDTTCNLCKAKRTIKHTYKAATCTKPKTCSVCKKTSGKALGHSYNKGVCKRCKKTDYDLVTKEYSGRWYLEGYADVCIDVTKYPYYGALNIESHNFSFPMDGVNSSSVAKGYIIYPGKDSRIDGWSSGIQILYDNWDKSLKKNKVVLGSNYIEINNHKFVKKKGTKDRYYDTCYKQALGTWYLYNSPESSIDIFTYPNEHLNIDNSEDFGINTQKFNLLDFSTDISIYPAGGGRADCKADWDKYGISISNGVLTITNSNGTRKFSKTKTYVKVNAIFLDESKLELFVDDTRKLTATIMPSDAYYKDIMWSSSNSSVATVSSNGVVTAKSEGSAVVTVKSNDGNYIAKCSVIVTIPRVNGISLNRNSIECNKGDSETLTATITPSNSVDKTVTWSSSDDSIVTVSSSGKIIAKKHGTATITVTTKDGGYTATCTVVVKQKPLKVSASIGISTRYTSNSIQRGISVTVQATDGSENYVEYSIKLYRNGTYIGEVSSKEMFVTPLVNGTYTAEVYVKDSSGNETTAIQTTTISY